jgi:hypothetical protein
MQRLERDELLQPTLAGNRQPVQPLYSQLLGYFISFFGGPMAGAFVTAANARRLGRLERDAWLVALGVVLAILLLWWQVRWNGNAWLDTTFGRGANRLAPRLLGLAYFLVTLSVYRPYYRHMAAVGIESPRGWRVGLLAFVVSTAANAGLLAFFLSLG